MVMTYFIAEDGTVYAYDEDQIAMGYPFGPMRAMTDAEVQLHLNPPPTAEELRALAVAREFEWRDLELAVVSRQLEAIEEDEADETPADLLPGTRKLWLKYRGLVSNWKEGAELFPDQLHRPTRPA